MRIDIVLVAARSVRLPDLDELAAQWLSIRVRDTTGDDDALAERLSVVLQRKVVVELAEHRVAVGGARELGKRMRQDHERLLRRAQARPDIVGVEERRVGGAQLAVADRRKPVVVS